MAEAISFMAGTQVQQELEDIFWNGSATSLDVERKHHQDRKSEAHRVVSVQCASRNAILRRYRAHRTTAAPWAQCFFPEGKTEEILFRGIWGSL